MLIANLKSGAEDKKYSDVEFAMWSLFTVLKQQTIQTMTMFQSERSLLKSMRTRKDQGLKELTWSEDIYQKSSTSESKMKFHVSHWWAQAL